MNEPRDELASILDKTDWRKTIQHALEHMVYSRGTLGYTHAVRLAIAALAITYPNWDAYNTIHMEINKIIRKKKLELKIWVIEHRIELAYPWYRKIESINWEQALCDEISDYLLNTAGLKRMLLYGIKQHHGGTQAKIPGVNFNKDDE